MASVLYLCDRSRPCKNSISCGNDCVYTEYPLAALNGECEHPELEPERFNKFEYGDGKIFYAEKEKEDDQSSE